MLKYLDYGYSCMFDYIYKLGDAPDRFMYVPRLDLRPRMESVSMS